MTFAWLIRAPSEPGAPLNALAHERGLVGAVDDRGGEPVLHDPGQAKQERGDPRGALHP